MTTLREIILLKLVIKRIGKILLKTNFHFQILISSLSHIKTIEICKRAMKSLIDSQIALKTTLRRMLLDLREAKMQGSIYETHFF